MKNLRHGIEQAGLSAVISCFASLDDRTALNLGRHLGHIIHKFLSKRNKVALTNMELCAVGRIESDRLEILEQMYENYGMTLAEFARLKVYTSEDLIARVQIPQFDLIENTFKQGKGILFLSGHYDNWELLIQSIAVRGITTDIVVRRQHNLKVDQTVNKLRSKNGINVITAEASPRDIFRALKNGHAVAVLMDVWGGADGARTRLFGHEVSTISGALEIARRIKTPIICGFVRRQPDNTHLIDDLEILQTDDPDREISLTDLLDFYHRKLEIAVREYPEFWLWTHKRFKDVVEY